MKKENFILCKKMTFFAKIILLCLPLSNCIALETSFFKQAEISLLYGIGSSASINDIIAKKKIIPPVSYFTGIEYRSSSAKCYPIKLDMQILKHFGRQKSFELVICPVIQTSNVFLGGVGFNWAIGNGISGLIGKYTDFEETKGVKTRRFLNYLLIEQNIFLKENPDYQFILRWHHRCHVFGNIAPKGTGSNFFVIGIKYLI